MPKGPLQTVHSGSHVHHLALASYLQLLLYKQHGHPAFQNQRRLLVYLQSLLQFYYIFLQMLFISASVSLW